jgi:fibronectin-binding autotransporter adhesin
MKTNRRNPLLTASVLALAGSMAHAGTLWFDGGTVNIAADGDGASAGVAGNWNTTLVNWDQGAGLPHVAWDNSAAPGTVAAFGGPVGNGNRAVTVSTVNAVDMVFSVTGTTGTGTRWTLSAGTITLGDSLTRKASIDASAMLGSSTVGVNVISALTGDVNGGLTLIGSDSHMEFGNYAAYFNSLNPSRRNLLSLSNLGVNNFTGPVTIKNAVEIQGLDGTRYKALGPATNDITLDNGTLLLYQNNGTLAQKVAVIGTANALSLNNNIASSSVSNAVTGGSGAVLWAVAGTTNGRLTFSGDLSGFAGTLKAKSSATGAVVIDTNTFGGTFEVDSASTLQIGNNSPRGTLGANNVLNNGTILFNRSDNYTYSGNISGTGTLTKQGIGTVTLAGTHTHDGLTNVTAGRLDLSGSLTGDISVTGGTISGSGSTAGKLTMSAGTAITLAGGATTTSLTVGGVEFFFPTSLDFASATGRNDRL